MREEYMDDHAENEGMGVIKPVKGAKLIQQELDDQAARDAEGEGFGVTKPMTALKAIRPASGQKVSEGQALANALRFHHR